MLGISDCMCIYININIDTYISSVINIVMDSSLGKINSYLCCIENDVRWGAKLISYETPPLFSLAMQPKIFDLL